MLAKYRMKSRIKAKLLSKLFLSVLLITTSPCLATPSSSNDNKAILTRVELYLNSFRSLTADFTQYGEDGRVATGNLYLVRPGRLRFEYLPPSSILIIGTGKHLIFHDVQLEQVSYLPMDRSPLAFLLERNFSFNTNDVKILKVTYDPGRVGITLTDPNYPDSGTVTIVFEDKPIRLRQWRIHDVFGNTTTISLTNLKTGLTLDPALFHFVNPDPFGESIPRSEPD